MIYIGVIGAASCGKEIRDIAFETGKEIAAQNAVLVCGGMGGVMEEACRGAKEAGGVSIGILPGNDRLYGNPYMTYSVVSGVGEARNSMVVKSSEALIAIDGSFGTLTEIAFALKWGKPVAGIGTWKMEDGEGRQAPVKLFDNPAEAVRWAIEQVKK